MLAVFGTTIMEVGLFTWDKGNHRLNRVHSTQFKNFNYYGLLQTINDSLIVQIINW